MNGFHMVSMVLLGLLLGVPLGALAIVVADEYLNYRHFKKFCPKDDL